jgi:hypothetical protein
VREEEEERAGDCKGELGSRVRDIGTVFWVGIRREQGTELRSLYTLQLHSSIVRGL